MRLNIFRTQKQRTAVGRLLDPVFPSWSAAPLRPIVQLLALGLFGLLLFYACMPVSGSEGRLWLPAETMLSLDPLVGTSSAIATGQLHASLLWAGAVLAGCLLFPRWFCGYVCPMGTLIDITDWALWRWLPKPKLARRSWMHAKYAVLLAVLGAAILGLQLSGFSSPLPILTRGTAAAFNPEYAGRWLPIGLLAGVLLGGVIAPRFWCRYLCPSGALQSLAGLLRLTRREVTSNCIECGRCKDVCTFDAIRDDFTTRPMDCTFCQVCGGACPVEAIQFTGRWEKSLEESEAEALPGFRAKARRAFLVASVTGGIGLLAGGAMATGLRRLFGAKLPPEGGVVPIRPPGALREKAFLAACVRCGACVKACPTNILQPTSAEHGFEDLWTPKADCNLAYCAEDCNNCGQVCPTGAIRPLPLAQKRKTKMGLAEVNENTCVLCMECVMACPYEAITDPNEDDPTLVPEEWIPPIVDADLCVGCGKCQLICYQVNVVAEPNIPDGKPAIEVFAVSD